MGVDIEKVISFCAVVETGSMTGAAQKLFCSQPSISKHIAALEEELQCTLFTRSRRRLVLTDSGAVVYSYALRWQKDMRQIHRDLYALEQREKKGICFGATNHIGTYLVPPALARYKKLHPRRQVAFTVDFLPGILRLLLTEQIRFALAPETETLLAGPQMDLRPIARDDMAVAVPKGHPLSDAQSVQANALLAYPLLLPRTHSAAREFVLDRLQAAGIRHEQTVDMPNVQAVKQGVLGGMGIAILSRRVVQAEAQSGLIACLPPEGISLRRTLYLVTRHGQGLSPEEDEFVALAQEMAQAQEEEEDA